jgi:2-polyprenyl-3-methyl-5-hydroxy-6-metoxy-1,4-benzoquinol methylase
VVRLISLLLAVTAAWVQAEEEARRSYNERYSDSLKVFSTAPNAFLVRMLTGRKPGRALGIGIGQGRNALWLAEQGWDVTGIDVSDEGVAQARDEAKRRRLLAALKPGGGGRISCRYRIRAAAGRRFRR